MSSLSPHPSPGVTQSPTSPGSVASPSSHTPSWEKGGAAGAAMWFKQTLPKSISSIASILSANSEEWKGRLKALQDLEKLALDCREFERQFAATSTGNGFNAQLPPLILTLAPSLSVQITDLRSEIVRQAAHTLSFLATQFPDTIVGDSASQGAFHKCGVKVLPALLTVAASSNGVIRGYAITALQDVVAHVCSGGPSAQNGGILGHLYGEVKNSKNKTVRQTAMELLSETIMQTWPRKYWCGAAVGDASRPAPSSSSLQHIHLEEHILIGLHSADTLTRAGACRAVWNYSKFGFPGRASHLFKNLEPRLRRVVLEARKSPEDDGTTLDAGEAQQSMDDSAVPSSSSALRVKKVPTPASSARGLTSGPFSNSQSKSSVNDELSDLSNGSINFSATTISDNVLSKGLAEARKKLGITGPTIAATTGAKRVIPAAGGATSSTAAASAATTAAGAKKLTSMGGAARVLKKPASAGPVAPGAAAAGSKLAGGAVRPSSAAVSPVKKSAAISAPSSPPPRTNGSLSASTDASAPAVLENDASVLEDMLSRPIHARTISMAGVALEHMQGLLNENELHNSSSSPADEAFALGEAEKSIREVKENIEHEEAAKQQLNGDGAPTSLHDLLQVPNSMHLKNLSVSSSGSDHPLSAVPVVPADTTATPVKSRIGSLSTGARTPKTPGGVNSASKIASLSATKKPATSAAALAAQVLLSKTSSNLKLPLKAGPASGIGAAKDDSALAAKRRIPLAASALPRRSLGATASSAALRAGGLTVTTARPSTTSDASAAPEVAPTTPKLKRPSTTGVGSATASASATGSAKRPVSATTATTTAAAAAAAGIHASPSAIPRSTTRTPLSKSPSRFGPHSATSANKTASASTGTPPLGPAPSAAKSLKFPEKEKSALPPPMSVTAPVSSAHTPASILTPVSANPLSNFITPHTSTLNSPAASNAHVYSDSTLLIPSNMPSPASSSVNSFSGNSASGSNSFMGLVLNGAQTSTAPQLPANLPPDSSALVKDHRAHLKEMAQHLQQLNTLLVQCTTSVTATAPVLPSFYVNDMIKVLSDNLAKTTKLLESFMNVKRKEIEQASQLSQVLAQNKAAAAALTINTSIPSTPSTPGPAPVTAPAALAASADPAPSIVVTPAHESTADSSSVAEAEAPGESVAAPIEAAVAIADPEHAVPEPKADAVAAAVTADPAPSPAVIEVPIENAPSSIGTSEPTSSAPIVSAE